MEYKKISSDFYKFGSMAVKYIYMFYGLRQFFRVSIIYYVYHCTSVVQKKIGR